MFIGLEHLYHDLSLPSDLFANIFLGLLLSLFLVLVGNIYLCFW